MPVPFGRLALHTWSIDTTPLASALDAARRGGFEALELRRVDFTRCFAQGLSTRDVIDMVRRAGLPVVTLGCEYGWLFAEGAESERIFDVLRETFEAAVALDCPMVMSAPGPFSGPLAMAQVNLRRGAEMAASHGVRLAIEFNSQHEVLNRLEVLRELIAGADHPACGMLLDAYHLHRSGRGGRGFEGVSKDELFAFQYSDCSPAPVTGVKRPMDRLLPGEGVVAWSEVFGLLAEIGYDGYLSYEAPNPALWERSPYALCRDAAAATHALLQQAAARRAAE